jgi:hypothetical protein
LGQPNNPYYDIYNTFWKQPLKIEQKTVTVDNEDGMAVTESFDFLMIHAALLNKTEGMLLVRQEYVTTVGSLEEHHTLNPSGGTIVLGHPGIGACLYDKFHLVGLSAI